MSILARAYDGSFRSIGFLLLIPLTKPPLEQAITEYHVPTTDLNVDIDMGLQFRNWSQKIAIDAADLTSIEGAVGHSGTYVGPSGTSYSNVKLKGMETPIKAPGFATYEITLHLRIAP